MSPIPFLWPRTQQVPPLPVDHVHVWAWDLDAPLSPGDWEVLSAEETLRARRFVFPRDCERYVRAHSTMRTLLSVYSSISPKALNFSSNKYGKPEIEDHPVEALHFNLTHSAGVAALAIARGFRVGIDVEVLRPMNADIAECHFSTNELDTLKSLLPEQWLSGFYRCWTGKEALLKGAGFGLNLPLDAFDVETAPHRRPALLASRLPANIAPEWLLFDLQPTPAAVGTLAILDETSSFNPDQLRCFSYEG